VHGKDIVSSNGEVNDANDTVTWNVSMAELMSGSKELRAEVKTSGFDIPWNTVLIIAGSCMCLLILLVVVGVVVFLVLRSRGNKAEVAGEDTLEE
jgi:hypothetical protein